MHMLRARLPVLFAFAFVILLGTAPRLPAQQALDRPLRVFLDCSGFRCDSDFFIQEVPWVSFVRDRLDGDVHVLGTRETTGSGGSLYTLDFQGRGVRADQRLTLEAVTEPDATEGARRAALVEVIRLGLAPFAAGTATAPAVTIQELEGRGEGAAEGTDDPWNRWVFRVGVDGYTNGESQQRFVTTSGDMSASRVSEDWKLMLSAGSSLSFSRYELPDTIVEFTRESYSGEGMAVKSVGEHWGVGVLGEWRRSTYNNYDASAVIGAAAEYNVFPFGESTRRLLTVFYAVGARFNDYQRVTIYDETRETLIEQLLVVTYDVTQPWGSIDASLRGDQYVAKFGEGEEWPDAQYEAGLSGGLNVRLLRGLSVRLHGSVGMVRNQVALSAADLTEEEILTQQRELATDYRYFLAFGLSYRFGSIFSDVINPRFERL
jgi:hypothetical protein